MALLAELTPRRLGPRLLDNLDRDLLEEYVEMLRNLRLSCPDIMESRGLLDGRGSRRLGTWNRSPPLRVQLNLLSLSSGPSSLSSSTREMKIAAAVCYTRAS